MASRKQAPKKAVNRGAQVVWSERGTNSDTGRAERAPDTVPPRPSSGPPETASLRAGVTESITGRSWPEGDLRDEESEVSPDFLRGELSRFEATLKNRDDTIGQLNRELGGMERRLQDIETAAQTPPSGLRTWMGKLGDGIGRIFGRDEKTGDETISQTVFWDELRRRGPLVPFDQLNNGKRIVAFTVFGLPRERLEKVLDTVERYCRKRNTVPVILTDSDCFDVFRARNLAFEYLPPAETRERFAPDLQWPLYFQRRLTVFRSKWRPAGIVTFGTKIPIEELEGLAVSDGEDSEERSGVSR